MQVSATAPRLVAEIRGTIERFSGCMRARVRMLAWLLLIFSVVSIATSVHLLRHELKGPLTDVPLAAAGPCQADEEWGKWRLSQNAIWRTGDDRFALRGLDADICHDFVLPRGGAAFLVVDTGGQAYTLALEAVSEDTRITPVDAPQQERRLYHIEGAQGAHIRLSATNPEGDSLTLRQVHATQDPGERLSSWNRDYYSNAIDKIAQIYKARLFSGIIALVFVSVSAFFVLRSSCRNRFLVSALAFASLALVNNVTGLHIASWYIEDLLTYIVDDPIWSGNLGYTIDAVNSLLAGNIDGYVLASYRKPLYFFLACAMAGLAGAEQGNFVAIYAAIAVMQVGLHVFCFFALAYVCARTLKPLQTVLACGALATLSISSIYVQVDTNIVSLWYLLVAFVLLRYRGDQESAPVRWGSLVGLHFMFALLTFTRSEWFVLWIFASIVMHWRDVKGLVVPAGMLGLFLLVQGNVFHLGTGNYKLKISSENVGHVAFVGLWQNDFHPFRWQPTDASYDAWISEHGYRYGSEAANDFAQPEVIRFYFTLPVYLAAQASHKYLGYFQGKGWTRTQVYFSLYPERLDWLKRVEWLKRVDWLKHVEWLKSILPVLFLFSLGYVLLNRSAFSLLLCAPVLISLPMFCVLQMSGGRFTTYITEAIIFASILFLTEHWRDLTERANLRRNALSFTALALVFFAVPELLLAAVKAYPDLMLAAPFLDPQDSTLYRLH